MESEFGITSSKSKYNSSHIHDHTDDINVAIAQSYFDEKVNDLFDETIESLYESDVHAHRVADFILNPRTSLSQDQQFCDDPELNDLIQQETLYNNELYDRLKAERENKQTPPQRGGLNFGSLFTRSSLERAFQNQLKDTNINRYQENTNTVKTKSLELQTANALASQARNRFDSAYSSAAAMFNKSADNQSLHMNLNARELAPQDLEKLLYKPSPNDEEKVLIIAAKELLAAETKLQTHLREFDMLESTGLLNVANKPKAEEYREAADSSDVATMAHNIAQLQFVLDPQLQALGKPNKNANKISDDMPTNSSTETATTQDKPDENSIKEAIEKMKEGILNLFNTLKPKGAGLEATETNNQNM